VHDGVDRTAHEHGGIIGDVVVDAFRKALLELHHFGAYGVGYGDGIAARTLEYRMATAVRLSSCERRYVGRVELGSDN